MATRTFTDEELAIMKAKVQAATEELERELDRINAEHAERIARIANTTVDRLRQELAADRETLADVVRDRNAARLDVARLTEERDQALARLRQADAALVAKSGGPGSDTAFWSPFGTVRSCRHCGVLVSGGPNACLACVERERADEVKT